MQKPDHEKSREELIAELRTARAEIADYKAAAENTPYYRLAADHARDVIWVTDRTFAVRYVSPSVRQVLGYHPHEILDLDWARILTPAGLEIFQTAIQYRLAMEKAGRGDGAPRLFESDWIRKDGKRITAETTTRTLRDEDGRFAGIVGISRDVTQRKKMMDQLRANETRFRAILDTGPTITWIKDEAGRYIYLSRNFEKYFGIRGEDWLGKTCHDLYPPEIAAKFTENDLQVIEKDRPLEFLEEADCADGERRVCRVVKIPIRNAQGKRSTAGFGLDITDQKRAEEDLRKSERRLQEAQRMARIANYERNLDTGRGCWSDEHYRLFGYQPGEVSHSFELFLNHIHSDDRDRIAERLRAAYQNLTAYAHDCRYVRRGGEIRHARHTGRGEMDPDGTRWLRGTFQDITEQKTFEEALRKSESHHRIIFEKSPLGMIRFSEDGAILDCNEQFIHLMDSSREKLIGFNTARQSTPKMRETIRRALAGNTAVFEDEYISVTGGKTTHLRVVFNPIHPGRTPTGVIATLEDITERKQTEKALQESEKRFRTIVDTVPQFIAYTDKALHYRFVNKAYQDQFGLSSDDVIGKALPQIIGRKAFEKARPHIEKALTGEVVRYHERFDYPVGGMRDMDGVLLPDFDEDGRVRGYYAVLTDITHYMAAADALRKSEERFRTIFENAGDAILVTNEQGKYVDANTAALNLTGYSLKELRGFTIQDLTPPGKHAEFEK
ncbi:MAG: PAS domain S-box protein, partial [Desulfococcaceae bacterium]